MASTSSVHVDVAVQAAAMAVLQRVVQQRRQGGRPRFSRYRSTGARPRQRVQVKDIYEQLGPTYFKRSYRMKYQSFKKLVGNRASPLSSLTRFFFSPFLLGSQNDFFEPLDLIL